jgi:hypothetical protein
MIEEVGNPEVMLCWDFLVEASALCRESDPETEEKHVHVPLTQSASHLYEDPPYREKNALKLSICELVGGYQNSFLSVRSDLVQYNRVPHTQEALLTQGAASRADAVPERGAQNGSQSGVAADADRVVVGRHLASEQA